VQKIRLKPMIRTYFATGTWDFLGVLGSEAAMVVPGDGSMEVRQPLCMTEVVPESVRELIAVPRETPCPKTHIIFAA
jgi:hypothetical protein